MFAVKLRSLTSSLSVRLTLWFVGVFSLCLTLVLILCYITLKVYLYHGEDDVILFELYEAQVAYQQGGLKRLKHHITEETHEFDAGRVFFRLVLIDGEVLKSTDLTSWGAIPFAVLNSHQAERGREFAYTRHIPDNGKYVRIVSLGLGDGLIIQGGLPVDREVAQLKVYQVLLPCVGIAITLLAAILGFLMARRAVRRVEEVTGIAKSMSGTNLDERVPVSGPADEIRDLAMTFNRMLDRITALIRSMKQVTDDLAHELRSPVARMRARAELTLHELEASGEDLALAANTIDECDRLLGLVNTMLDISEVESGTVHLKKERLNISDLLRRAVEVFEPVAAEKSIALRFIESAGSVSATGDKVRLERVFSNLIDNAIKYTPAGGSVEVSLIDQGGSLVVQIEDNGRGIAKEHLPLLCDRFYRVERSRTTPGTGLGLSVAQSLIRSHDGTLSFESEPERGTTVRVELPV